MTFNSSVQIEQSSTTDKTRILRGLGDLFAAGGTEILTSIVAGYETLDMMPTTNKVLVYLTDAALGVDSSDKEMFDETLEEMKEKNMNVLWVGLGMEEDSPEFVYAAEKSGGQYVVSEDVDVLREAFDDVLRTVKETKTAENTNVRINIEKVSDTGGARTAFTANQFQVLSPLPPLSGEVVSTETINYETGTVLKQYDAHTASLISGDRVPGNETKIQKRMPLEVMGENQAMEIEVSELIYMSTLYGVDAPYGHRYLAVDMSMNHILPKQEVIVYPEGTGHPASWVGGGNANEGTVKNVKIPYMIPDFKSHFYVTYNDEYTYPASEATWLAATPVALPGNQSITLMPDQSEEGVLIFVVPEEATEQCSLHFYDVNYGHVDIPLVGEMVTRASEISSLPTEVTTKLNDVFELGIRGYEDSYYIGGSDELGYGSVYRVVEGDFVSNVQALIDIDPSERFSLRYETDNGNYYVPLDPITSQLPAGFYSQRMMAPGSFNFARWAFTVPEGLESASCDLFIDLADGDGVVKVNDGTKQSASKIATYKHEYFTLDINGLTDSIDNIVDSGGDWIVGDITIHDVEDDFSTQGLGDMFVLIREDQLEEQKTDYQVSTSLGNFSSGGSSNDNRRVLDYITESLVLGIDNETIVYDGTSLRGQIVFSIPYDSTSEEWVLTSPPYFEDMALSISSDEYDTSLFGYETVYEVDTGYSEGLSYAIDSVVSAYRAAHPEMDESLVGNSAFEEEDLQDVLAPAMSTYGNKIIEGVDDLTEMFKILDGVEWTAKSYNAVGNYDKAPEAVITGSEGTAMDMAYTAYRMLCRLGYKPNCIQ